MQSLGRIVQALPKPGAACNIKSVLRSPALLGRSKSGFSSTGSQSNLGLDWPSSRMHVSVSDSLLSNPMIRPEHMDRLNAILTGETKLQLVDTSTRDVDQSNYNCMMTKEMVLGISERASGVFDLLRYSDGTPLFTSSESRLGGNPFRADAVVNGINPYPYGHQVNKVIRANASHMDSQILFRGQCGGALKIMPNDVIQAHLEECKDAGVTRVRLFWALNISPSKGQLPESNYYKYVMDVCHELGLDVEGAICYQKDLTVSDIQFVADTFLNHPATVSSTIKDMGATISPLKMLGWVDTVSKLDLSRGVGVHTHSITGLSLNSYFMAAMAGATRFDVAWDPISFAYGQPAVTAFLNVFGLTDLVTGKAGDAFLDLNRYIENKVKPDLKDVSVASPHPNMDVIKSGMATGAIAHYETELTKAGKAILIQFMDTRVEFLKQQIGNPSLVTPSALYVSNQAIVDMVSFDIKVTKQLQEEGYENGSQSFHEEWRKRLHTLASSGQINVITNDIASIIRGDFGLTIDEINPDLITQVMTDAINGHLKDFPFFRPGDEFKQQFTDGMLEVCLQIISQLESGGLNYEQDYLPIKRSELTDEVALRFIKLSPGLIDVFDKGFIDLGYFKTVLSDAITTVGVVSQWLKPGMPDAYAAIDNFIENGGKLPEDMIRKQAAILYAKFGKDMDHHFKNHQDRSQFGLAKVLTERKKQLMVLRK